MEKLFETDWLSEDSENLYCYFTVHAAEDLIGGLFDEDNKEHVEILKAHIAEFNGPAWVNEKAVSEALEVEHVEKLSMGGVWFPGPVVFRINSAAWLEHLLDKILSQADHRTGYTGADFGGSTTWILGDEWYLQDDENGHHAVFQRAEEPGDPIEEIRIIPNPDLLTWLARNGQVEELKHGPNSENWTCLTCGVNHNEVCCECGTEGQDI